MNIKKQNNGTNTIIEIELDDSAVVDSLALGMITNNAIKGIASATCTQIDSVKNLRYVVNEKISMQQLMQNPVNKRTLLGVFSNILKVLISAEDYMLNSKTLILDKEYIFVDPATYAVSMICVPLMKMENEYSLYNFFKNIVFSVQVDFSENSEYVVRLINYFNTKSDLDRIDFATFVVNLLNSENGVHISNNNSVQTVDSYSAQNYATQQSVYQASVQQQPATNVNCQQIKSPETVNFAENVDKNGVFLAPGPGVAKNNQMNIPDKQAKITESGASANNKQKKKGFSLFGSKKISDSNNSMEKKSVHNNSMTKFAIPGQVITADSKDTKQTITSSSNVAHSAHSVASESIQPNHNYFPHTQQVAGNFGETTVLGAGMIGETTVLSAGMQTNTIISPHLIRLKNNEKIPVNKPVFRIGKEKSYVDYFIGDNSTISRSHANIITREGKYFIVDTNSTNHTFLDGSILQSNSEYEISHGSKLRFANEDFEFKLY